LAVNTGIFEPLLQLGSILEGYVAVVVHWWTGELITRGHAIAITRALAQLRLMHVVCMLWK
jgi:hypothetical protein